MTPYENIKKILAQRTPSMRWDMNESFVSWQQRSKEKLKELIGLNNMIPCDMNINIEWEKQESDFKEIRFSFESEPGYFVPCHLLIPNGAEEALPLVICVQGHSKGMHNSLGRVKFKNEKIEGDRDFCIRAIKEGFVAIALEQRNFGECGGDENGPKCYESTMSNLLIGRTTIGERVWDIMRLIDVIEAEFSNVIKLDEIYTLGNSGGGTASVYSGALEDRLAGTIPSCAVSSFAASIGAMHHCSCNYVPHILEYFDMSELLAMTVPKRLVVVSGKEDDIFPLKEAIEMVEIAREAYAKNGVPDNIAHCIGDEGHRFYADIAWEALNKMRKQS